MGLRLSPSPHPLQRMGLLFILTQDTDYHRVFARTASWVYSLSPPQESGSPHQAALLQISPAGRVSLDTLCYPRRGYFCIRYMGETKAPATLTVPGLSAIS